MRAPPFARAWTAVSTENMGSPPRVPGLRRPSTPPGFRRAPRVKPRRGGVIKPRVEPPSLHYALGHERGGGTRGPRPDHRSTLAAAQPGADRPETPNPIAPPRPAPTPGLPHTGAPPLAA